MDEKTLIQKTQQPITIKHIVSALKNMGITPRDRLIVHTSLSSLGWVCGGAQAVIMALMEVLNEEGTLVMPAHSGDWSNPEEWEHPPVPKEWISIIHENMPAFDPAITPTRGMGRVAELFRTLPGTLRSNHPQVSFAANGKDAHEITKEHPLTPQLGIKSPLGKLYELDAKVLLLGVGYDSCTSFHLGEALIQEMPVEQLGTSVFEEGKRVWKWFEDVVYDSEDFIKIGEAFEKEHVVQSGYIGMAPCKYFSMREGVDFSVQWLKKNRELRRV